MNMQQAAEFADGVVKGTIDAVVPPVQWTHGESTHGGCGEGAAGTGSVTRRAVIMTEVSAERRGSFVGVVERYWKKQGYEIRNVRKHKESPAVFAATPEDFRMSLVVGYKGQVFIDVVTPCMTESEVSPPKTQANGPDYSGERPPTPNHHSDFWSARTPVG
ncbi:hypothetical protein DVA86_16940 [Streptomyces armeniacus]|uniref:Uncharacterized protein n=2 Tax=Streptomyces armeniacus TaxID=83291 RepID=A0A345Y0I2_9ACTN|nr:hypothetical protein DVA86_16940 [Streptomyces armeniacus]